MDVFQKAKKTVPATNSKKHIQVSFLHNDVTTYCDLEHVLKTEEVWLDKDGLEELLKRPRYRKIFSDRLKENYNVNDITPAEYAEYTGPDVKLLDLPYETVWQTCLETAGHLHTVNIQNECSGQALREAADVIGEACLNAILAGPGPGLGSSSDTTEPYIQTPSDDNENESDVVTLADLLHNFATQCFAAWLSHIPDTLRPRILLKYPVGISSTLVSLEDIHFLDVFLDNLKRKTCFHSTSGTLQDHAAAHQLQDHSVQQRHTAIRPEQQQQEYLAI